MRNIHVHIAYLITKSKGWEVSARKQTKGWGGFIKYLKQGTGRIQQQLKARDGEDLTTTLCKGWGGSNNNLHFSVDMSLMVDQTDERIIQMIWATTTHFHLHMISRIVSDAKGVSLLQGLENSIE